jgi:hypothetical protein
VDESSDLFIPPELETGVYADWVNAWFSRHQLTLDFAAPSSEDRLLLTARVRVPVTAVLDVLRSLERGIREYELQYGEIRRPRQRGEE